MRAVPPRRKWIETVTYSARTRVPYVRGRLLAPFIRHRLMRFPSFPPLVHAAIAESDDYFRYSTLGLALQRLRDEDVPGALAEVGVWRGETSRFLHSVLPDRELHLFDTFEGFPGRDLPPGTTDTRFRDTSEAAVRARVGPSPRIQLHPGFVPETLAAVAEERFAFALLDLDLYEPTRASLEFFYERLSPGGYLVVHDYNNTESDWACKRAFDAFLEGRPERVVELGDVWGSALIRRLGG
jgi:O-methyltransferase